ncbi:MAG: hypothetical protein JWM67_754 [Mycobacterium sp.]|nr:hypothetical protein [Mycobacterium sp.]
MTQLTAPVPTRPPAGIPGEDPGGADLDAVASWATEIAREGVRSIEQVHGAVAGRVFGALGRTLGPSAAPSRVLHDGIAGGVYAAVRGGVTAAGFAARAYAALRPEPLEVGTGRRGGHVWGALAGAFGDHLDSHHPGLAPEMAVRIDGRDVPATPEALRAAFPDAAGHVVVFLHGLCETEDAWGFHAGITWGDPGETYGRQLARAGDWTPVYVRYNTGLHVSENGRRLGALLHQLVTAWPVPVQRVALVGHSMGGLVSRSAVHQASEHATEQERAWTAGPLDEPVDWTWFVSDVVTLGTPHLGARLEAAALTGAHYLHALPETRPLARALRARSVGIKDLGHGHLVDEDWQAKDLDALRACDRCTEVPFPSHIRHRAVAATITRDPAHPLGRVLGDLLVHVESAHGTGPARRIPFETDDCHHVGGAHHFDLLNNRQVSVLLQNWLCPQVVGTR